MTPTLREVETWAIQAGAILRQGYGRDFRVEAKGPADLVTEMDRRSEDFLIHQIRSFYPHDTIITEESGQINGETSAGCWYIDPLDGTLNYAHGVPLFAVSLAYAENGQVKRGVIYDPMLDECFSAERGKGAWLNGVPIHVSAFTDLHDCLLVTGFPVEGWNDGRNNLELFSRLSVHSQGVRRLGSAAINLAYVASGRLDGFWENRLKAWDVAAGTLIAEEAGACVSSLTGNPNYFQPPYSMLVANPNIHALMFQILQSDPTEKRGLP